MDKLLKFINQITKKQMLLFVYIFFIFLFLLGSFRTFSLIAFMSSVIHKQRFSPKAAYNPTPFSEKTITDLGNPSSIYRGGIKRNGVYNNSKILPHLKVLWKTFPLNDAIHGASKASPAVDDSGIYVGGDDGWFYAFDHDGNLKWKYYTFDNFRGIHSTAALTDKYVFFGSYNGRLYAAEKSTGQIAWSLKLADAIGSSPLIYKNHIYVSVETAVVRNGYVAKIHAKTGKVIWRTSWLGEQIHSSVTLNVKNNLLYVGANNGMLYTIKMDDGLILWGYPSDGPIKGTPLYDEEKNAIYFSNWRRRLTALNAKTGETLWETLLKSNSQSSPTEIPFQDTLVVSSHRENAFIYGIKKSSGALLWKRKFNHKSATHSGMSSRNAFGKWMYYGVCSKTLFCVLDPKTGKSVTEINIEGLSTGAPVAYKSFIYLSLNNGGLVKIGSSLKK